MSAFYQEQVIDVQHWTDTLFSFTATRDPGFRFQSGQFTMMGLEVEGRPLLRAYSMASANHEETLEFFSIKVPDGPLTSRLQQISVATSCWSAARRPEHSSPTICCRAPAAAAVHRNRAGAVRERHQGPRCLRTMTSRFLVHGCRQVSELSYGERLVDGLRKDEVFGPLLADKLHYYPTVTREPFRNRGRITDLIASEKLFEDCRLVAARYRDRPHDALRQPGHAVGAAQ